MSSQVEISKRLVLINAASSAALRALSISVLVWLQQYLLKRIGPEEYALYPVLAAALAFFPLLTGVLTYGLGRYSVVAYAKNDERGVTQIVSTMFPLTLAGGVAVLVAGWVFAYYVDHILTIEPARLWDARIMAAMMAFSIACTVAVSPFAVGFYVRQKFVLSNLIGLGQELFRIALLFVLLFGVSTRMLWVVVASVSAQIVWLFVTFSVSRRLVPALRFRRGEIRWGMVRNLTSFGGWAVLGQLAETIRDAADPLILNKLAMPVDVTCFYVGSMPNSQVRSLPSLLLWPLLPQLTAMHATGKKELLQNAYLRGGRYALWITMVMVVPLMIYAYEVVALYLGETYENVAIVMILLLASSPFIYGHLLVWGMAVAMDEMRSYCLRLLIVQLVNLGLTLYLVGFRHMGAVGSALGTFLAMTFVWPALNWPLGLRLTELSWSRWFRETAWPGLLPAVASTVVCYALKLTVRPSTWLELGLCATAGIMCFAGVVLLCMQPSDRVDIGRVVGRIPWLAAALRWRKGNLVEKEP
jgi:O-antigen/teichoic acid export membrane protein